MKNLGERIKQAIARIEAMQEELDRRLKELEEVVQIDDCTHRDNTHCTLRNKQCYGVEHCSNYRPIILKGGTCNLAPWEKAEDYGIVKYTKEGLYDYGYNPSIDPEELPF